MTRHFLTDITSDGGVSATTLYANTWVQAGQDSTTGYIFCNLNGASGSTRYFQFQTASGNRWAVGCNNTAESSTATGSDFFINSFDNSAGYLATPVSITRASGIVSFAVSPVVPTPGAGDNSTKAASTAFVTTALAGASGGETVAATPPSSPVAGQKWWSTSNGRDYIYTGSAWAEAAGLSGGGVSTASANTWTAPQRSAIVALTDATTIAVDFALGNNFSVTLAGARTLGNPSNIVAGQSGQIVITQDGTGSRTLAYASDWKFPGGTAPVLTTAAGGIDIISYFAIDSSHIAVTALLGLA